ncbi:MAG: polyamine ABC transporter substrate-binding protein [Proteobacteria bacterium]|nr:polyamine ABC transporter substrate-binding protein [Pseudomonadota bacterium]
MRIGKDQRTFKKAFFIQRKSIRSFIFFMTLFLTTGNLFPLSAQDEKVLNIYNWTDDIAPDVLRKFEEETGIKVNYDVYDSDEVLEAKLLLGNSGYDVVFPSANPFFARQIKAGIYEKIDKSQLKNYHNLDANVLKRLEEIDPENNYGIPYSWGTIGIAYNPEKLSKCMPGVDIEKLTENFGILFNSEIVQHFATCGVSLQSSALDVFNAILVYAGVNPNTTSREEFEKAVKILKSVRPFIRKFTAGGLIEDLATGETCLALGWSGDVLKASLRAKELNQKFQIKYAIPKEGAEIWFEVMAIPKDAPHRENAYKFIDFILRPQVIAEITNYIYDANPNKASLQYVAKEVRNNPIIYPPASVMKTLFVSKSAPQNFERWRSRAWIRIKTGI